MVLARKKNAGPIEIQPIRTRTITVGIKGTRPLILNRLTEKARQELLMPARKSAATRRSTLKHDVYDEFRSSPYTIPDDDAPTLLGFPASAFKQGMVEAAGRVPGGVKAEIRQLVWTEGDLAPIYGSPRLLMSVTRSAGMNRTPDVRTRTIVPEWGTVIAVTFTDGLITETSIANLLSAAGQIMGVGDWRPEKGSGTFGQYELVNEDDPELQRIMEAGGRDVQQSAMDNPIPYDVETEELLSWFDGELKARGIAA